MHDLHKTTARQHPGRSLLLLGVLLALAGPVLMMVLTFGAGILVAPWYAPLLGTLGVALLILALVQSRSAWRWAALVVFTPFVAFQWAAVLAMRTPDYTGPVRVGEPFPAFATTLADGSPYAQADLKGDRDTVMVFFRGRW